MYSSVCSPVFAGPRSQALRTTMLAATASCPLTEPVTWLVSALNPAPQPLTAVTASTPAATAPATVRA